MPYRQPLQNLWTKFALFISSTTTAIGMLSLNEWAALIGIVMSVLVGGHAMWCRRQNSKMVMRALRDGRVDCATCEKLTGQ